MLPPTNDLQELSRLIITHSDGQTIGHPLQVGNRAAGAAPRDGLSSGYGQGHDQRGEGQRPDDA